MEQEQYPDRGERLRAAAGKLAEARAVLHQASMLAPHYDAEKIDALVRATYGIENELRETSYPAVY